MPDQTHWIGTGQHSTTSFSPETPKKTFEIELGPHALLGCAKEFMGKIGLCTFDTQL